MIELKVSAGSIPEMADKLAALALSFGSTAIATGTVAAGEPEKPAAKPRAKKSEAPSTTTTTPDTPPSTGAETPTAETTEDSTTSTQTAASPSEAPKEQVKAEPLNFDTDVAPVVIDCVKIKGKPFVEETLAQFGAAKASQVDEARWPELVATLKEAMAA